MKVALLAGLLLLIAPALAQTMPGQKPVVMERIYAKATAENMLKAMLRASALDASDPVVRDDYLLLNECQIYIDNYQDDFKLDRLRRATQQVIEKERAGWPDAFVFTSPIKLDTYDFTNNSFKLAEKSQLKNVNSFALLTIGSDVCLQGFSVKRLPKNISVRIDQPVTVTSVPISQQQGKDLLGRMMASGNNARQVFARFNIDITYMPPIDAKLIEGNRDGKYVFDGSLVSIEFFEDAELTKPIWSFVKS